jgi:hypothetical protein
MAKPLTSINHMIAKKKIGLLLEKDGCYTKFGGRGIKTST